MSKPSKIYRDSNLLTLAQGEKCLLRSVKGCLEDEGTTTVAAHSNWGQDGKGKSLKASDAKSVWSCYRCHSWLDQGMATNEKKQQTFDQAFEQQIEEWVKIAENICLKPWKVKAARDVLDHLGVSYGIR